LTTDNLTNKNTTLIAVSLFVSAFLMQLPKLFKSGLKATSKSSDPKGLVEITKASKRFRRYGVRKTSYSSLKSRLLGREKVAKSKPEQLIALDDISLKISPGSSIGIIGKNGSGKSTLLKLIAGIYQPDSGSITVSGKISALIELGAGFHPDFTGRENIYLNGIMYGLSRKEIEKLL